MTRLLEIASNTKVQPCSMQNGAYCSGTGRPDSQRLEATISLHIEDVTSACCTCIIGSSPRASMLFWFACCPSPAPIEAYRVQHFGDFHELKTPHPARTTTYKFAQRWRLIGCGTSFTEARPDRVIGPRPIRRRKSFGG